MGSSYSEYLIKDMLRERFGYDEVVCTDWNIVQDTTEPDSFASGKCWGVENFTVPERCLKIILAGVDQFGGLSDAAPVKVAYNLGCQKFGDEFMRKRLEQSAVRILKNIFRTGLFENPYLDVSERTVGKDSYVREGYEAQRKSMVLLKNKGHVLPLKEGCRIYIPKVYVPDSIGWTGEVIKGGWKYPDGYNQIKQAFQVTETPEEADAALCLVTAPAALDMMRGYDRKDVEEGGNGYIPISLQYRPYTALEARQKSIAGEKKDGQYTERSYYGKTVTTKNEKDLDMILETRKEMGDKPVIVCVYTTGPFIVGEFERETDVLVLNFNDSVRPFIDLLKGEFEPSGLLPFQMPADMETVEKQKEDVAFDMECHIDTESHIYNYAYGMSWNGQIQDGRTEKYKGGK